MLSRPTTEQILLDCCRELMTGVLPALSDETAQVRVVMIETVLRSMAVRSAHEIAWMLEEIDDINDYVQRGRAPARAAPTEAPGLHLDEVVEAYCRAGRALADALEAAVAGGDAALVTRGEDLLGRRAGHEVEVMAGWSPTGR